MQSWPDAWASVFASALVVSRDSVARRMISVLPDLAKVREDLVGRRCCRYHSERAFPDLAARNQTQSACKALAMPAWDTLSVASAICRHSALAAASANSIEIAVCP